MPNPSDQNENEVHEGTAALQDIADDVVAERERAGNKASLPDDDTPEDDGETREDHEEDDSGPLADGEIPPATFAQAQQTGGTTRP